MPYSQPSFLCSNEDEDNSTMADVPWLLGALRCCSVFRNLTRQFTLHVLSTIAKVIENELWLYQSHRIAVDVLVKLAKPIVFRDPQHHSVIHRVSGLQIEVGTHGVLLSLPPLRNRESGEAYERRLTLKLNMKKDEMIRRGYSHGGQPVLMLVDHPAFMPGLARAVHSVYHCIRCIDKACPSVQSLLTDLTFSFGSIFALDLNHRNFTYAKLVHKACPDKHISNRYHKEMISLWGKNRDAPGRDTVVTSETPVQNPERIGCFAFDCWIAREGCCEESQ